MRVQLRRITAVVAAALAALYLMPAASAQTAASCEDGGSFSHRLSGEISRADFERYLELPFEVPAGVKRIDVTFDYEREHRTTIDLGLSDPRGIRGWSGGNKRSFFLAENAATPSYSTGPIEPGSWRLILGVPNIREGVRAAYQADILLSCASAPRGEPIPGDRGSGWYVGDLHAHSGHSDGSCAPWSRDERPSDDRPSDERPSNDKPSDTVACPAFLSAQTAAERGLDFLALSEHNAVSHHTVLSELQGYYPDTLLLAAREVTTFYGHANVFGTTEFIDFRLQPAAGVGADSLLAQVDTHGALLSINHPGSPSGEDCMGCGWVLPDTDFSRIEAIEIVNTGFVDMPRGRAHIEFWHERLNQGHRITGIAGSDNHGASRPSDQPSAIGNPRTWIYAQSLSEASLLEGIRSGNVYIDASAGSVTLENFSVAGQAMGGTLASSQRVLPASLSWTSEETLSVRWIVDGEVFLGAGTEEGTQQADELQTWRGELQLEAGSQPRWIRFDLVSERGATRLLGNPVYFHP